MPWQDPATPAYTPGAGLALDGNTLNVGAGTGISVGADSVGVSAAVPTQSGADLNVGLTSQAAGDLLVAADASKYNRLAKGANNSVLQTNGSGALAWSATPTIGTLTTNSSAAARALTTSLTVGGLGGVLIEGAANGAAWQNMVSNVWSLYLHNGTGNFVAGDLALEIDTSGNMKVSKGYIELSEMTAPANAAANKGRLFMEDSGGKTRLMVIFPSGASQQIAIEP